MALFLAGPNPRWRLAAILDLVDFAFDPRVGFSGMADRMDLLPVVANPRFGDAPSWKISNEHISGMSYPIHFHELESSLEE